MSSQWESASNLTALCGYMDEVTLALRLGSIDPSDRLIVDLLASSAQLAGQLASFLPEATSKEETTSGAEPPL